MRRLTGIAVMLLCLLGLFALPAQAEVPEGYPAIRIDPTTGLPYDFEGRTVYIYDWWTGVNWSDTTPVTPEDQALYDYRSWLESTYNCRLVQTYKGDWGSQEQELERFVCQPDGTLCVYILTSDSFCQAMKGDFLDTWDVDLTDDKWNSAVVSLSENNGQTWSLSADPSEPRQMLFFNKTMLTDAGYDWHQIYNMQAAGTWDWDAFEDMLALTRAENDIFGLTGSSDDLYRAAVFSNGGSFFERDANGDIVISADSPETIAALNWAKRIWRDYCRKPQLNEPWDYFNVAWQQGEAAFFIGQAYQAQTQYFDGIDWGCAAFPVGPDGAEYVTVVSNNVTVLPKVYDAHTKAMLSMIYDLWTTNVPGIPQSRVPASFTENGDADACATYAMLQENGHTVPDMTDLLGSTNDILGSTLLWYINNSENDPEDLVNANMAQWQEACDIANGNAEVPVPVLRNDHSVINFYAGLPGFETVWSQNYLTGVFVTNYQEMRKYGGVPSFDIVQTGDEPLNIYWGLDWWEEYGGLEAHLDVRLDDIPDHAMSKDLTITCTWNGKTASTVTTVYVKELVSQAEGIDTPKEWILDLGETFTVAPHILPDGYDIPGYSWQLVGNSGEFDKFAEEDESLATDLSRTYTATKPGSFEALVALQADTVIAGKFVNFRVKDENGNLPLDDLPVNEANFPDERFRAAISEAFDWNGDGKLDSDELRNANDLNISYHEGEPLSLQGLELLPELRWLQVFTPVTGLDLSGNPKLSFLNCFDLGLTELDVSHNPELESLSCYGNEFTELDVSNCPALCETVQNSQRRDYGNYDWIGGSLYVDYDVTVTAGNVVSEPIVNGQGSGGENAPTVDIPATIALGQDLTGSISGAEGANETWFTLYIMRDSVPERLGRYRLYDAYENTVIFRYDAYGELMIQEPGEYRLMVESTFDDEINAITIQSFTIAGTRPDAPQVTASTSEVLKSAPLIFEIQAENIQRLRVKRTHLPSGNTSIQYPDRYDLLGENGNLWETSVNAVGEYQFRFALCEDGIWSGYSDPITVHVITNGMLPIPEGCTVPSELRAGEPLIVQIAEQANADYYHVRIETNSSYYSDTTLYSAGKQTVEKYGLDSGEYTVFISTSGDTYDDSEPAMFDLTVTGERPAVPSVKIPSGTHYYSRTYWVTLQAEGLEGASNAGYFDSGMYLATGNKVQVPVTPYRDTFIGFRAKIDGCWTDIFEVDIPCETLPDETVLQILSIPGNIQLGDDLPVQIALWEEAAYYTYSVSYPVEGSDYAREQIVYEEEFIPDQNGNFIIPAPCFTHAGECDIGVNAYATDYRGKYGSSLITVTGNNNRPAAPVITQITQNPKAYEDVAFEITAPGASRICLMIRDANNPDSVDYNPMVIETNGQNPVSYIFNSRDFLFYNNDAFLLSACAYTDAWSDYCEPVLLNQEQNGSIYFEGDGVYVSPEYSCIGDDITLVWEAVSGAEYFTIWIDGTEVETIPASGTGNIYTFSSTGMSSGEHSARITAWAPGKARDDSYADFRLYDLKQKPSVQTDKIFVQPNEPVTLTIRTKAGEMVILYVNGNFHSRIRRDASGMQTAVLKFSDPGSYEILVSTSEGYYDYTGNTLMSDPVTVAVSESVSEPDLVLPLRITRIDSEAFAGVTDVVIWVPATVNEIAEGAFDPSVTIMTPAGSYASRWAAEHGLDVLEI